MLLKMHPGEYGYFTFTLYGFIQFSIGYVTGYSAAKSLYCTTRALSAEDRPLLAFDEISPASADTEGTSAA